MSRIARYKIVSLLAILVAVAACNKTGLPAYTHYPAPAPDSTGDIRAVLAASPYDLFEQALLRSGLDTLLPASGSYTIFAPVDSAMQAAGLTAAGIAAMAVDSLQKIIMYHITNGVYSPAALTANICSIEALTMRHDYTYDNPLAEVFDYQQPLFVKINGSLYINGELANAPADTALVANNGYIFPIRAVQQAPATDIWQILQQRPELSMYLAALRLDDSIYNAMGELTGQFPFLQGDSTFFNYVYYINESYGNYYGNPKTEYTVFAPTDSAFAAAGFHTVNDLRAYAERSYIGQLPNCCNFSYTALDSVLNQHVIGNTNYAFSNLSLYNDLLFNPDINSGQFNVFGPFLISGQAMYSSPFGLQFFNQNNTVYIQWSGSSQAPRAQLPAGKNYHFLAQNGVVYEIDQLFYPHN